MKDTPAQEEQIDFVKTYFLPYLNVVKFCSDGSSKGCFYNGTYKKLNGDDWGTKNNSRPKVLLADGTAIQFAFIENCLKVNERCLSIDIDTNGYKKPNTVGLDYIPFSFYPQTGEFLPQGVYDRKYNEETKTYTRLSEQQVRQNWEEAAQANTAAHGLFRTALK